MSSAATGMNPLHEPRRPAGLLGSAKAVAWAFLGIRRNRDYQDDLGRLNPLSVILVALVAVLAFVGGLIALVHWVVK